MHRFCENQANCHKRACKLSYVHIKIKYIISKGNMNNFIQRKTVEVQYKQTAIQAIQDQTTIHEIQA